MAKIFRNNPLSCDVIPQLRLAMASGSRYNFWFVNRSTSNSIPIRIKKTGIERTIGFTFKRFIVYLCTSNLIKMVLKIFKAVWFLSVLAVLANLLYVYAGLPEQVLIQDESTGRLLVNRE